VAQGGVRCRKREDGGNGETCITFNMTWTSIRQEAAVLEAKHEAGEGQMWEGAWAERVAGVERRGVVRREQSVKWCIIAFNQYLRRSNT
jgi:hypothetical protein